MEIVHVAGKLTVGTGSRISESVMDRQAYDTDLTNEQWALMEKKYNEVSSPRGRKPDVPRRDIFNAILYRPKTGCQWRNLPHDFPHWNNTSSR